MSDNSKIEWTDATWNPVRGCTKISDGCKNCYAYAFAERWRGIKGHPFEKGFDVVLVHDNLDIPIKWKRPRMIFVNSMSDLFHEKVPDEFIKQVIQVMLRARQHIFWHPEPHGRKNFISLTSLQAQGKAGTMSGELHSWFLTR